SDWRPGSSATCTCCPAGGSGAPCPCKPVRSSCGTAPCGAGFPASAATDARSGESGTFRRARTVSDIVRDRARTVSETIRYWSDGGPSGEEDVGDVEVGGDAALVGELADAGGRRLRATGHGHVVGERQQQRSGLGVGVAGAQQGVDL